MILLASVYQHVALEGVVAYESFVACWTFKFLHFLVLASHHLVWDVDFERVFVVRRLWNEDASLLTVVAFVLQVADQA